MFLTLLQTRPVVDNDTSDILGARYKRRKHKTEEELLEEYLAQQIVLGRRQEALQAKQAAEDALAKANLNKQEKAKKIRLFIILMMMDEL